MQIILFVENNIEMIFFSKEEAERNLIWQKNSKRFKNIKLVVENFRVDSTKFICIFEKYANDSKMLGNI